MTSLQFLREALMDYLAERDIPALGAFPAGARKRYSRPLVVASVQELSAAGAGFANYLGERYDEGLKRWEERFGLSTTVSFSLDVYSPRQYGEGGVRELIDRLAEAFSQNAPAGLGLKELSWGPSAYDESSDMFRAEGAALCEGVLCAVLDLDGDFISFEVRGGVTLE